MGYYLMHIRNVKIDHELSFCPELNTNLWSSWFSSKFLNLTFQWFNKKLVFLLIKVCMLATKNYSYIILSRIRPICLYLLRKQQQQQQKTIRLFRISSIPPKFCYFRPPDHVISMEFSVLDFRCQCTQQQLQSICADSEQFF